MRSRSIAERSGGTHSRIAPMEKCRHTALQTDFQLYRSHYCMPRQFLQPSIESENGPPELAETPTRFPDWGRQPSDAHSAAQRFNPIHF